MENKVLLIGRRINAYTEMMDELSALMEYTVAEKWSDAVQSFITGSYCIVVLDATESVQSALNHIHALRFFRQVPIIALYSSDLPESRGMLLDAGATSCIDQQLQFRECAAQIKALLNAWPVKEQLDFGPVLAFGDELIIAYSYRTVLLNGAKLHLSRLEFSVLYFLACNENRVFSKEELYRQVWGKSRYYVSDDPVKSCIKSLRRKLKSAHHEYIQNEWGIGYKFVGAPNNM